MPQRVAVLVTRRYKGRAPHGLIDPEMETPLVAVFNLTSSMRTGIEAYLNLDLPSRIDVVVQVDGKLYGTSTEIDLKFRTLDEMNAHAAFIVGCPVILPPQKLLPMTEAEKQRVITASSVYGGGITKVNLVFNHPMNTGWWFNSECERVPRNVIETIRLSQAGKNLGTIWMGPGMSKRLGLMFKALQPEHKLSVYWHDTGANSETAEKVMPPDVKLRYTAIQHAATDNDTDWLQHILDGGIADITKADDALRIAANHGHTGIVKMLLEHGINIDAKFNTGQTALIIAAEKLYVDTVRLLINKGANLNARGDQIGSGDSKIIGNTPLTATLREQNGATLRSQPDRLSLQEEIVRLLLAAGAEVNAKATDGKTALQIAREMELGNIVKLLRKAGGE